MTAPEGRAAVIFDEAQALTDEVLDELRLLSNLGAGALAPLKLVLVGQPELIERLKRPRFRALNQRIGARAFLNPLSPEESAAYVEHRMRAAGSETRRVFSSRALARAGFSPTPISIQVNPGPDGSARPAGTGNVTAMLARGYIETLFKTADTPLGRELETAVARYPGVHLAAFSVADAAAAHRRLTHAGFRMQPLAGMQRPVDTVNGPGTAAFTLARLVPGEMPEGRIQILTHRSEDAHQDHREVSMLTWNTFRDHVILEYEIPKWDGDLSQPNLFIPASRTLMERKAKLLYEHFGTQRSKHWFDEETFRGLARLRSGWQRTDQVDQCLLALPALPISESTLLPALAHSSKPRNQ